MAAPVGFAVPSDLGCGASSLRRANASFTGTPAWRRMQRDGMATDVSWRNRASQYAELYRDLVARRLKGEP